MDDEKSTSFEDYIGYLAELVRRYTDALENGTPTVDTDGSPIWRETAASLTLAHTIATEIHLLRSELKGIRVALERLNEAYKQSWDPRSP
jgi:hypothetical protein